MKKILLLCGICIVLNGCCSKELYQQKLSRFIGQPEINLIATLGHPVSMYPAGAYKSLEYYNQSQFCLQNNKCKLKWCITQFFVRNGIVENFNFKGNHCCSYDF